MNSSHMAGLSTILYNEQGHTVSKVRRFQGKRFVFRVSAGGSQYKIFLVLFADDGSFFVDFPYYSAGEGIVAEVRLDAGMHVAEIALPKFGKITSHRVKFSYHPDGKVHFSQDGKVLTRIRKETLPLTEVTGHVFTVYAQGLQEYEVDKRGEQLAPSKNRTTLSFRFEEMPNAVKFVGRWYKTATLLPKEGVLGPQTFVDQSDKPKDAFLIGSPQSSSSRDYCLLVSCESAKLLDQNRPSLLTFIGGFDQHAVDGGQSSSFLALHYPVSNYEELSRSIGTIDYHRNEIL